MRKALLKGQNQSAVEPKGGLACDPGSSYTGTGAGLRVLIYSHDTFGLGHLRRCLKISKGLKSQFPDLSLLLVTGSPQVHRYSLPQGIDYIKLPAVRKTADDQYEPRNMRTTFERIFNIRSRLLFETAKQFSPHVLLVDHSPLGMKSEMLPTLEWIKSKSRDSVTLLGLRDILDEPMRVIRQWKDQSMFERIRELYDKILIYGSPAVFDPVKSYEFPSDIADRTSFCGYVTEPMPPHNGHEVNRAARKFVLVTIGGGDGAGEAVAGTYIGMLNRYQKCIDFDSMIITGPFITEALWRLLRTQSRGLPITIRRFVKQTRPFLRKSDLVISTGGYNTTTEVLTFGQRALFIPRIMYRNEQLLRSMRLCELGLAAFLHPDDASPERLFEIITEKISSSDRPLARARESNIIQLDGTENTVSHFRSYFAQMRGHKEMSR